MATTGSDSVKRADLAKAVSERLGGAVSAAQISDIIELTFNEIAVKLYEGEVVKVSGWAIFEQVQRAARVARNPRTGETVRVRAKKVIRFRPGTRLELAAAGTRKPEPTSFEVSPVSRRASARRSAAVPKKAAPAKRTAAKKASPTTARKTAAKKAAPAKVTTATKKAAPAKKTAAKKASPTTARKTAAKKAAPAAQRTRATTAAKKAAPAKVTTATKKAAPAKKTAAKKASPTTARKTAAKKAAPAKG